MNQDLDTLIPPHPDTVHATPSKKVYQDRKRNPVAEWVRAIRQAHVDGLITVNVANRIIDETV